MASLRTYALCVLTALSLPIFTATTTETPYVQAAEPDEGEATIDVPGTLRQGEETTVYYSDENRPGETVYIDVEDGVTSPSQIPITLDENGNGIGTWTPPSGCDSVNFNHPDATEVTKPVFPGS